MPVAKVSDKTVGRLSLYRRLLSDLFKQEVRNVHSHQLAGMARVTAAQVRRDMMAVGCAGTPVRGYPVAELIEAIGQLLDAPQEQPVALVGAGNLGKAITAYFAGRRPKLSIVAAFDSDTSKVGKVINGCRCYAIADLEKVIQEKAIRVAVLTVPANAAQPVADRLVRSGVKGILNFAPMRLHLPEGVYIENMDMAVSLEKVAFFSRHEYRQEVHEAEEDEA